MSPPQKTTISAEDISYLTQREKTAISEINKARTNPIAYITVIENYIDSILENENNPSVLNEPMYPEKIYEAAYELINELKTQDSLQALEIKECLCISSRKHGEWQGNNNTIGHKGQNNSSSADRIIAECGENPGVSSMWSENIYKGQATPREVNIELLLDIGIPNRGHRKTILSEHLTKIGVSEVIISHNKEYNSYYSYWVFNFSNY